MLKDHRVFLELELKRRLDDLLCVFPLASGIELAIRWRNILPRWKRIDSFRFFLALAFAEPRPDGRTGERMEGPRKLQFGPSGHLSIPVLGGNAPEH